MIDTNSRIFIIHTSWYKDYIDRMVDISIDVIKNKKLNGIVLNTRSYKAPGALELAALGAQKVAYDSVAVGVIFHGIIIRGETSHYDLVTQETFRSIGKLADDYVNRSFINNVICVENENQLEERLERNTKKNTEALIELIRAKEL